jgi:hypothetical protein
LLLPVGRDRHSSGLKRERSRTAASPKLAFRKAATQVSPVTMLCPSQRTSAPPYLPVLKGDLRLLLFAFGFYFGLVWCGKLLEGKRITEGLRIAKKKLLKAKEWLKTG